MDRAVKKTDLFIRNRPKEVRKSYGQFFTGQQTARFMASLLEIPKQGPITILDPGSGTGILSAALLEQIENCGFKGEVELTCYETDELVLPVLEENLQMTQSEASFSLQFTILSRNYILEQANSFEGTLLDSLQQESKKYNLAIVNPPYRKIAKDDPQALAVPSICKGDPNLYFIFTAIALFNLEPDGQMSVIIPRSWTSGLYFRSFRNYLVHSGSVEHLHLFVSRSKVFDKDSVLQETIIVKLRKAKQAPKITMTSTESNADFNTLTTFQASCNTVIFGPDNYFYLVTNPKEVEILHKLSQFKQTLPDIGLKMKTGLTVDFRVREDLRNNANENTVPLFYSHHLKGGRVEHPIGKEGEWLETGKKGLLQPNTNYLFVKRFTAKEEKRRLQSSIYLADSFPDYELSAPRIKSISSRETSH